MTTSIRNSRRAELVCFAVLLVVLNAPVLTGSCWQSLIFQPAAVRAGEWSRVVTHPFVHATWYHLLLDGAAFLLLYESLIEAKLLRRLGYMVGGVMGSLLFSWATLPAISSGGLCGLSGVAHGLMAVSAVEMLSSQPHGSAEWRLGLITLAAVVGKAALEAITGKMFFTFLHFGLMGEPVAVSHAGGIVGALVVMLLFRASRRERGTAEVNHACQRAGSWGSWRAGTT
jgi:rhomboid family GlyGly-CTERM serine protease